MLVCVCVCEFRMQVLKSFPNDVGILKPRVSLGSNHIEIDLRKVFLENITLFMN